MSEEKILPPVQLISDEKMNYELVFNPQGDGFDQFYELIFRSVAAGRNTRSKRKHDISVDPDTHRISLKGSQVHINEACGEINDRLKKLNDYLNKIADGSIK